MIRYLFIARHAKAEDGSAFMGDFDRQLVPSGIMAAARMGKNLRDSGGKIDVIKSSSAPRAYETAKVMAEQLGIDIEAIETTRSLYDEGPKAYLAATVALPDNCQSAMLVGHNPDVSFFTEYLTKTSIGSMSKSSVAVVMFENLVWNEISAHSGKLVTVYEPSAL